MPIPYEELKYKDILHHQGAYECFDKAGTQMFSDWNMVAFEKAVLGCGESRFLNMAEKIKNVPKLFDDLNEKMPFLKFKEYGQHYAYELFLSPPKFWGSRGAPLYWAYVSRNFTYDKLPMNESLIYEKYLCVADKFEIDINSKDNYYIERFSAGGMSSGIVTGEFVRNGWETIKNRNKLY